MSGGYLFFAPGSLRLSSVGASFLREPIAEPPPFDFRLRFDYGPTTIDRRGMVGPIGASVEPVPPFTYPRRVAWPRKFRRLRNLSTAPRRP